ncbi:hypothetical protein DQ04_07541010 [Trypanosoma grayi]|uniref:hypothetical protein n=1 Tax=Trypanosoma grayi TaxID=71804 RepID=UPI0004F41433|nr:hypothetical protein DQ04_07541010 [Trypanosoma grayi]KEG08277.1 hypothetical protein DQ04_07541010 [Trypanosoma grayi]
MGTSGPSAHLLLRSTLYVKITPLGSVKNARGLWGLFHNRVKKAAACMGVLVPRFLHAATGLGTRLLQCCFFAKNVRYRIAPLNGGMAYIPSDGSCSPVGDGGWECTAFEVNE